MEESVIISEKTNDEKIYVLNKGDGHGDASPVPGTVVRKKKVKQVSDRLKNEDQ